MSHTVQLNPRIPGECSFIADWGGEHACCGQPAKYRVTSRNPADWPWQPAELCAEHAAHVRACPDCLVWLAAMETA
jgi:hypothetical protein